VIIFTCQIAEVNIWGVVRVTKAFLPLIRQYQGRIVNVASMLGRSPALYSSAYCISKFGVEAFSDILRLEMARFNVGVFTIEPGNFLAATEITGSKRPELFCNQLSESILKDYGEESIDEVIGATEWMSDTFGVNE
jgi:3-hydroxybutyrate dehydrogenase